MDRIETVNLSEIVLPTSFIRKFPSKLMIQYQFIPIHIEGNILTCAFGKVPAVFVINYIERKTGYKIKVVLASAEEIQAQILINNKVKIAKVRFESKFKYKKSSRGLLLLGIVSGVLLVIIVFLLHLDNKTLKRGEAEKSSSLSVNSTTTNIELPTHLDWIINLLPGRKATLHSSISKEVMVAIDEASYEEMIKLLTAGDIDGLRLMILLGRILLVKNNTSVLIIETSHGSLFSLNPFTKVRIRILDGEFKGYSGWIYFSRSDPALQTLKWTDWNGTFFKD